MGRTQSNIHRAFSQGLILLAFLSVAGHSPPALAAGTPVEEATGTQKATAQEAFNRGDEAFDVQDYEAALEHYQQSFDIVASPNSQLMVARSLVELGRLDEAYAEYGKVITSAEGTDDYEVAYETATKERAALTSRLAWVTIERGNVPEGAQLEVGERVRESTTFGQSIPVNPGKTMIRATTPAGEEAVIELHLAAGRRRKVILQLGQREVVGTPARPEKDTAPAEDQLSDDATKPPSIPASSSSAPNLEPWAYVAGGVGVAGMATFATFGIMSGDRYAALEEACTAGQCPPASQSDIDEGKQFQTLANVGFGVGLAGIGTGVFLYVLDMNQKEAPVAVDVGWGHVQLKGEF